MKQGVTRVPPPISQQGVRIVSPSLSLFVFVSHEQTQRIKQRKNTEAPRVRSSCLAGPVSVRWRPFSAECVFALRAQWSVPQWRSIVASTPAKRGFNSPDLPKDRVLQLQAIIGEAWTGREKTDRPASSVETDFSVRGNLGDRIILRYVAETLTLQQSGTTISVADVTFAGRRRGRRTDEVLWLASFARIYPLQHGGVTLLGEGKRPAMLPPSPQRSS